MAECLAVIDRGDFSASKASKAGSSANCLFCLARGSKLPAAGKQVLFLQGSRAGIVAEVSDELNTADWDGFLVREPNARPRALSRVSLDRDLFSILPIGPVPDWCPPFDIGISFVVDELAVWFCNESFAGEKFHWQPERMHLLIQVCWQRRIAIKGTELSAVMMAHGMPSEHQQTFEVLFDFGFATLICAAGRKPIKKLRQGNAMKDQIADAMRAWHG
jgi:hypothetical protein